MFAADHDVWTNMPGWLKGTNSVLGDEIHLAQLSPKLVGEHVKWSVERLVERRVGAAVSSHMAFEGRRAHLAMIKRVREKHSH